MRADKKDTKIVILGMGYLMEYIYPCYEALLGENISTNILAVTADVEGLPGKLERCAFPVILNDSLGALQKMQPDLVLFAPPPSVAPGLIEEALVPYFAQCREAGRSLPVIFAFPPNPVGQYYLDKLGSDIRVANILPNMVTQLGNMVLRDLGLTYVTFPDEGPWEDSQREFLDSFFAPMGGTIEVKPSHLMEMLAGTVAVHLISQIVFTITDTLAAGGHPTDYRCVASSMRAAFRKERDYDRGSVPCEQGAAGDYYLAGLLGKVVLAWYDGMYEFYRKSGLSEADSRRILTSLLDLHLLKHQLEARSDIEKKTRQHATKGGVLEKGIQEFPLLVETMLRQMFFTYPAVNLTTEWTDKLSRRAAQICAVVTERGRGLHSSGSGAEFRIEHHAVCFGLLAKYTLASGAAGAREALSLGVIQYARERGSRMRQRCQRFGDPLNMLSYKVYCEWQPENEVMASVTLQRSPVHKTKVTDCHWVNDWKRYGLLEYGKYYCDYADQNLVKGFSDKMSLEMGEVFSRGADCCAFTWCGADMTDENEAWVSQRRGELMETITMGWEFHTAHLYHTIARTLENTLGEGSKAVLRNMRREFATIFSEDALAVIDSFENQDFTVANYR